MTSRSRPHDAHLRRPTAAITVALALLCATLGVGSGPAGADTRSERDKVRKQAAELAAQLDVLRAEDAEVEKALIAVEAELTAQQARVAGAQQAADVAEQALAAARSAEAALTTRLTGIETTLREVAIDTYVRRERTATPKVDAGDDLVDVARQRTLTEFVAKSASSLADELHATQEDLGRASQQADAAAKAATDRHADAQAQLTDLAAARSRQAAFAAKLDARIERGLAEAAGLSAREAALSAQYAQEQAALAAKRRTASTGSSAGRTPGPVPLRTVGGITVHADIADQLEELLAAARRAGIVLGGGGYRDPADQMRLREAHCADPVSSPAISCRPPTARPGHSMHEEGLAVDFTHEGRIITSRSNPAFRWLAANAGRFGLQNLPSEPWHWSTTGD